MFVIPRVLSLITTRRCTAACDHCCFGCGPTQTAAIPVERMKGLIAEARRIPSIRRVVFTGGECFLLRSDLDALVSLAHTSGFQTRAISNAYWSVSEAAATNRLTTLRFAGLDELMLSTGTFHQRFVPVERVIAAARASVGLGISTRISVEACDQSTFGDEALREVLSSELATGLLCIAVSPWIEDAGGRGETVVSHSSDAIPADVLLRSTCTQVLNVLTVTPDQILTACCGFPMEYLEDLQIGSVAHEALDDVVRSAPSNLFAMWMHARGPASIAAFVRRFVPDFELPAVASICEACTLLQRNPVVGKTIAEHARDVIGIVAAEFAMKQTLNALPAAP